MAYPKDSDLPGSPFSILLTALGVLAGMEISAMQPRMVGESQVGLTIPVKLISKSKRSPESLRVEAVPTLSQIAEGFAR